MRLERGDIVFFQTDEGPYVDRYFPDLGPYRVTRIARSAHDNDLDWVTLRHLKGGMMKHHALTSETHACRLRRDEFLTAVKRAKNVK